MGITGIIRPPPDIRAVADRTALFVSKNGRAFENKILNSEKGKTPKFAFLHETSPFHAYYENRIQFYEQGGTDEEEKKKEEEEKLMLKKKEEEEKERLALKEKEEAAKKREAAKKASAVDPVARALLASRSKISDARRGNTSTAEKDDADGEVTSSSQLSSNTPQALPTLRHVAVVAPANLTPLEIDIIKVTAQYVALSDKHDHFLRDLTIKEWSNPEFSFLQPRHAHFAYFSALVDDYKSFLPGGDDYEKAQNKLKMDTKKEQLTHLIADNASVDLKTKTTTIAQCLEAAAYRAEYERDAEDPRREAAERAEGSGVLGGADTIDWHDFVVVETIDFPQDEAVEAALPPPTSMRLAVLNNEEPSQVQHDKQMDAKQEDAMDESSEEEDDGGEKLNIVANYQPKVVSTKEITGDSSRTHIVDPISGKQIAVADMPEHMRIQLLDPKWAEERKRFLEKQRETNFVAGEDIASNISRLAQARGDIFGSSAQTSSQDQKADFNQIIREQTIQPQPQPDATMMPPNQPLGASLPPPPPPPPPTMTSVHHPPPPPPPPPMPQPSAGSDNTAEPVAKRPKLDIDSTPMDPVPMFEAPPPPPPPPAEEEKQILSESDFIATLSNPEDVPICIQVPRDSSNSDWNFNGQIVDISLTASSKLKEVKAALKPQLGNMPMNKMQLKHSTAGFLKDTFSLAHYNIGPMTTLELVPKTRGGRK